MKKLLLCLVFVCLWLNIVESTNYVSTIAGGGVCDGASSLLVSLHTPSGLAINSAGEMYISDTNHYRIRKVFTNGTIITVAGIGLSGDLFDSGSMGTSSRLNSPYGVAINSLGEVYFADRGNNRIRKLLTNGILVTVAGTGSSGVATENVPATTAKLNFPNGVAIDSNDIVYFADTNNNRIRKILKNGNIVTVAGSGNFGGFSGDNGLATSAQLSGPTGVAINSLGEIFIADQGNARIRKVATNGTIFTIAGTGNLGNNENGALATNCNMQPNSVAVNSVGEVFLTDNNNYSILKILTNGTIVILAGQGLPGFSEDYTLASDAKLSSPKALVLGPNDEVYFADQNNRIRKIMNNGTLVTIVGIGTTSYCGDGDIGSNVPLDFPYGIAVDSTGTEIYFSDSNNQRIRKISANGKITTVAGNGDTTFNGDGLLATASGLYYPQGICVTPEGEVIIAEQNRNRVRKVFSNGTMITIAGTGSVGDSGDGGLATSATLYNPTGVFYSNGEVFIADKLNHKIRKIGTDGVIVTVAGTTAGSSGDNGPATSAQLSSPQYVHVTNSGEMYIADTINNKIRKVFTNGTIVTIAGTGSSGSSGDGGLATSAQLRAPTAIAISAAGEIYIADKTNNKIRKISTDGIISTFAGSGSGGFNWDGPASTAMINGPTGVAIKANGDVVVADFSNSRIRNFYSIIYCNNVLSSDSSVCNGNGTCIAQDVCQCHSNYTGTNCQNPLCNSIPSNDPTVCNGHGSCIAPNLCQCNTLYNGQFCESAAPEKSTNLTCFGIGSNSSIVCSGHGRCVGENNCSCDIGYTGNDCSIFSCFNIDSKNSSVCSGKGKCSALNYCGCDENYSGDDCSRFSCFGIVNSNPSVCSGSGECISVNSCKCNATYYGDKCQSRTQNECNGKNGLDPTVCSSRGSCISGSCICHLNYTGINCEYHTCHGISLISAFVCSGKGNCISMNNCTCNSGYWGENCEHVVGFVNEEVSCYGISQSDMTVCNGKGACTSNNTCKCLGHWGGDDCSSCEPSYGGINCEEVINYYGNHNDKLYALFVLIAIPIVIIVAVIIGVVCCMKMKKKKDSFD